MTEQSGHGDPQAKHHKPAQLDSEKANDIDGLTMEDDKVGQDLEPGEARKYTESVDL